MTKMKTCPVCGSSCFDDMEMCFDCLHRFDGREDKEREDVPAVMAEYSKMPSDCSEGMGSDVHCVTLRIQLPEEAGEFTLRCENLQIGGVLLA